MLRHFAVVFLLLAVLVLPSATYAGEDDYRQCDRFLSQLRYPFSPQAIYEAKALLIRMQREYQRLVDRTGEIADADHVVASKYNARFRLPSRTLVLKDQEVMDIGLEDTDSPVSFGLRSNPGLRQSPRTEVLTRLQHLVSGMDDLQAKYNRRPKSFENTDEFAVIFKGRKGLRRFVREMIPGLKSVRNHAVEHGVIDDEEDENEDEDSDGEPRTFMSIGREFIVTMFSIWFFPGPNFAHDIEAVIDPVIQSFLGIQVPSSAQSIATVLAGVRAAKSAYDYFKAQQISNLRDLESLIERDLLSHHEGYQVPKERATVPHTTIPARQPIAPHTQFLHFMKAVNDVYMGRKVLDQGEMIYFGSSYHLYQVDEGTEPEADRHFDMVLFNDKGQIKLIVFNRQI